MSGGTIRLPGSPGIDVRLRESGRAKRVSLRVSSLDGSVTLTRPRGVSAAEALRFADTRRAWLERAIANVPLTEVVAPGAMLPVRGEMVPVVEGNGRAAQWTKRGLEVPLQAPGIAASAFLKLIARDALATACDRYSKMIDRPYTQIALRDTRSRWGSCTTAGRLMFSWRLAMAPPDVLDYVAAHEVAHLRHMDHSAAYWSTVEEMVPDWRSHRAWLRTDGAALHRYRFTA